MMRTCNVSTGGSIPFSVFTATLTSEKNAWDAVMRSSPACSRVKPWTVDTSLDTVGDLGGTGESELSLSGV